MRDDAVEVFQRISKVELEIQRFGPSQERNRRLAWLRLAYGDPDAAIDAVTAFMEGEKRPVVIRDALWLSALALALKVAIVRGEAAGAPHISIPPKTDMPSLRRKAIDLLKRIPIRDAEETRLLRALKMNSKLDFVEDLATVTREE